MTRLPLALLAAPVLAGLCSAQVAPGVNTAERETPAFKGVSGESQCDFNQLKGDAPGTYTASVTLSSTLVIGIYDQVNQTFKQTNEAAALNPNSGNFGLMLDSTGKYCVFDRSDGVYWSYRSGPGVAFPAPIKLNAPLSGYVDPALGYLGGKLQLFWTTGNDIRMQELDISTVAAPKLVGTVKVIATRLGASGAVHSPTPVYGPDGDVEGLWLAESLGTDMYFKPSLDPNDKHIKTLDNSSWSNNGGVAGAHLLYARSGAVRDVEAAYMTGDVESPGGTVDIGVAAPSPNGNSVAVVWMSDRFGTPLPLPAPLNVGMFGLNPGVMLTLGVVPQIGANDYGALSFKTPNNTALKGSIPIQGLSSQLGAPSPGKFAFTNTAHIVLK